MQRKSSSIMHWQVNGSYIMTRGIAKVGRVSQINGHVEGNGSRDLRVSMGEMRIGVLNAEGRKFLEFCDEKELCVANTWVQESREKESDI